MNSSVLFALIVTALLGCATGQSSTNDPVDVPDAAPHTDATDVTNATDGSSVVDSTIVTDVSKVTDSTAPIDAPPDTTVITDVAVSIDTPSPLDVPSVTDVSATVDTPSPLDSPTVTDVRVVNDSAPALDVVVSSAPELVLRNNNDLDFWYVPRRTNTDATQTLRLVTVISGVQSFFANGGSHIVFAMNPEGSAGERDPHCGPVIRHSTNLFTNARGFILFPGDNDVRAEHWNGTASPGIAMVSNTVPSTVFHPATEDTLHVRVMVGYRSGVWANTMTIEIRRGDSVSGPLLFSGIQPGWGWNWTGSHNACIGIIANGFVSPNDTACTEVLTSRSAPNASLRIVTAELQLF